MKIVFLKKDIARTLKEKYEIKKQSFKNYKKIIGFMDSFFSILPINSYHK